MNLQKRIKEVKKSNISKIVDKRVKQFSSFKNKSNKEWFSELCFCLLTANSKAKTAIAIQKELGHEGFMHKSFKELSSCILNNKHRFHNNKAKFIISARKYSNIKDIIKEQKSQSEAREWLVKNVKGLGYKESSHFLRNTGHFNLAILDRHILSLMNEHPKSLNKKKYLRIEKRLKVLANELKMNLAELDLYMWYIKTNEVLK